MAAKINADRVRVISLIFLYCLIFYSIIHGISIHGKNSATKLNEALVKPRIFILDEDGAIPYTQRVFVTEYYNSSITIAPKKAKTTNRFKQVDPFQTKKCRLQYDWQDSHFPSCNLLLEIDMTNFEASNMDFVGNGAYRDVWVVNEPNGVHRVLKTLRYKREFEPRNYDRHRRDAIAMERLTSSPNIVDIFGFCGNSGLFEFSEGGTISDAVWSASDDTILNKNDKLKIAIQVARAISDVHNIDKEGQASIAHTDITMDQFLLIDGEYKLNDFNRCRLIRWNRNVNKACGFVVGANKGKFRSPEEYRYDEESEKVDVYSMGNIFYQLLTGEDPFERLDVDTVRDKVMNGDRPLVSKKSWKVRTYWILLY